MNILFLSGLFPKEIEEDIIENSIRNVQNAANNLQWELVKGIEENVNKPITVLNSLYIGSYPLLYRKLIIKTSRFSHNSGKSQNINVGFFNFVGLKRISKYCSLKPYVRDWILSNKDSKKVIIAYAMTSTFIRIIEYAKKIDDKVISCLIVPDLPQYMRLQDDNSKIYTILKNIEVNVINKRLGYVDSFVLLTNYMKEAIGVHQPYVVVEGISTDLKWQSKVKENKENEVKTILYSGGLNKKYGIIELLRSFELIDYDNCRLIICGSGDAEDIIKEASRRDKRIIFKGLLKREDILELQKEATMLINPRSNKDDYTKYSFPSKILEYMSSGRPVLAYMLDGMPDEYKDYIYIINDDTEDAIYYALKDVLKKGEDELYYKGKIAREFVLNEKNRKKQCEKIINMLSDL